MLIFFIPCIFGTFADFVNSELVGLVFNVLNGWEVEISRNATIFFIQELHSLSRNVNHAYFQKVSQIFKKKRHGNKKYI